MEFAIYAGIAIGFAAIGFVVGILVGKNNPGDVDRVLSNIKQEYYRDAKRVAELKAKLEAQGIKL